jgi:hypothetical protein
MWGQNSARTIDALNSLKKKELKGDVVISMDTLIQDNYYKHLVQNSKDIGIEGYRIRIFSDIGLGAKDRQKRVMAKFLSLYPEIYTYHPYDDSYYKIYVGDFRTKRDALKVLATISKNFPDAFIVEDKIVIED